MPDSFASVSGQDAELGQEPNFKYQIISISSNGASELILLGHVAISVFVLNLRNVTMQFFFLTICSSAFCLELLLRSLKGDVRSIVLIVLCSLV